MFVLGEYPGAATPMRAMAMATPTVTSVARLCARLIQPPSLGGARGGPHGPAHARQQGLATVGNFLPTQHSKKSLAKLCRNQIDLECRSCGRQPFKTRRASALAAA